MSRLERAFESYFGSADDAASLFVQGFSAVSRHMTPINEVEADALDDQLLPPLVEDRPPFPLLRLPPDLLSSVLDHVGPRELCSLACARSRPHRARARTRARSLHSSPPSLSAAVCTSLREICDDDALWKRRFERRYGRVVSALFDGPAADPAARIEVSQIAPAGSESPAPVVPRPSQTWKSHYFEFGRTWMHRAKRSGVLLTLIDGRCYDVTAFAPEHPGNEALLAASAGADATSAFEYVGHSMHARMILRSLHRPELDMPPEGCPRALADQLGEHDAAGGEGWRSALGADLEGWRSGADASISSWRSALDTALSAPPGAGWSALGADSPTVSRLRSALDSALGAETISVSGWRSALNAVPDAIRLRISG